MSFHVPLVSERVQLGDDDRALLLGNAERVEGAGAAADGARRHRRQPDQLAHPRGGRVEELPHAEGEGLHPAERHGRNDV